MASFFVSRVDTEVDKRLDKIGTPEAAALRGKAAIANARLAYQHYEQTLRPTALAGAEPPPAPGRSGPLWASTGVKDPAYDDTRYVADLVAPGVVNTMPEATLRRGRRPRPASAATPSAATTPQAQAILDGSPPSGSTTTTSSPPSRPTASTKFQASWDELLGSVAAAMHANRPAQEARP